MRLVLLLMALVSLAGCSAFPPYYAWQQEWEGKAELAKADFSKQVSIQEAKAKEEAAHYLAKAEVARAEGVAQANKIIGDSLKEF
jgi:regulator of protease activity HflC (stomatin/prohibitin superfamily)